MPYSSGASLRRYAYIVEDDGALRKLVRRILAQEVAEIMEFSSAEEFLEGYSGRPIGCVLLDVRLPGMGGLELLEQMANLNPANSVVIMSAYGDVPSAVTAIQHGAVDFVQKPFRKDDLLNVVRRAFAKVEEVSSSNEQLEALTPREREVLNAFRHGEQNKVVAAKLGLSPRTVEMHRARIFRKLGVANLPQALLRIRYSGA